MAETYDKPFATAADLERRWRTLSDDEKALADIRLADVADLIRSQYPGWVDCTPLTLERISCQVVRRSMESDDNGFPAGATNVSSAVGQVNYSFGFSTASGELRLWPSEERELGKGRQRAFSIDMMTGG